MTVLLYLHAHCNKILVLFTFTVIFYPTAGKATTLHQSTNFFRNKTTAVPEKSVRHFLIGNGLLTSKNLASSSAWRMELSSANLSFSKMGRNTLQRRRMRKSDQCKVVFASCKTETALPVIQGQVTVGVTIHQPPAHKVYKM